MGDRSAGLRSARRAIVEIAFFSFFVNAMMLVIPLYMLQVYDRVLTSSSLDTLTFLSIMAAAALLLLGLLEFVRGVYANRVAARLDVAFSEPAIVAAMDSPRAALGDIQPLRDLASIRAFLSSRTVFALFDLPYAPFFIALLLFIHPVLFWLTAIGAVFLAMLAIINQFATSNASRSAGENSIAAMMTAQSFVRNAETLKAMGMIDSAMRIWAGQHVPALEAADAVARTNALFTGLSRFFRFGLQIAVLGMGAFLVLRGQMTPGMIFAAVIIAGKALQPLDQVIGGWRTFVDVRAAWSRLKEAAAVADRHGERTELPAPEGRLDIERLVYAAPGATAQDQAVLKGIGFSVPVGTIVGVIGPSGAGKSTLARLIVGAIRPRSGVVRIDGADIANWPSDSRGRYVGYLAQDVELLPGTIAQNIARFDAGATEADIFAAARRAQVHDLIQSLPNGYDTPIGAGGVTLSGGQRQRIGLARAFFKMPRILVLDEPNANLDGEGEKALEKALDEARAANTTVLIITQRTAIASKVDALLVLRNGTIEDYGPRKNVLEKLKGGGDARKAAPAAANTQQGPAAPSGVTVAPAKPTPVTAPAIADRKQVTSA